jgi:hypothetical protein
MFRTVGDEKPARISAGLRDALDRIRDTEKSRILWADALCINQQDDKERASQVRLMGLIYWKAQRVHIWLGPGKYEHGCRALNTASAVDLIKKLDVSHDPKSPSKSISSISKWLKCGLGNRSETLHHQQWNDLSSMFERPWFKRVWVVQELGLSKEAIFYYGKSSFTRDELDCFLTHFHTRGHKNIPRYSLNLQSLRVAENYYLTTRAGCRLEFGSDPNLAESFLDVLERARGLQCTDPRDGIYAFLGHPAALKQSLLDDKPFMWYPRNYNNGKPLFVVPDYSRANTLARLYVDVAIEATKKPPNSVTVLCYVAHIKETLAEGFSSWIPRWDLGSEPSLFYRGLKTFYGASGDLQSAALDITMAEESYGEHKLRLMALHLGTIRSKHHDLTSSSFATTAYEFLEDPEALCSHRTDERRKMTNDQSSASSHKLDPFDLAITLTAGYTSIELQDRPAEDDPQNHFDMFSSYLRRKSGKEEWLPNANADSSNGADRFAWQLQRVASQRTLFYTTNGFLGLGPSILHETDEVWLPIGAKMPFVLRPVGVGLFKVLGQTYMQGVMRGEAVIGLTKEDFQFITLC